MDTAAVCRSTARVLLNLVSLDLNDGTGAAVQLYCPFAKEPLVVTQKLSVSMLAEDES
jgi:hypothetical protein